MEERSGQQYDAYCAFIERHRETVWRTCYHFAKGNRVACEDMVQEVWIALWLRFDQLKTNAPELMQRAWLKRVTQSVLVDLYRRAESEPERLTPALVNTLPDTHVDYAESIDDLMSTLSDDEERLLRMRLEGYDAQEIADEFKMERNAVYVRINRIITKLRRRYGTGL